MSIPPRIWIHTANKLLSQRIKQEDATNEPSSGPKAPRLLLYGKCISKLNCSCIPECGYVMYELWMLCSGWLSSLCILEFRDSLWVMVRSFRIVNPFRNTLNTNICCLNTENNVNTGNISFCTFHYLFFFNNIMQGAPRKLLVRIIWGNKIYEIKKLAQ